MGEPLFVKGEKALYAPGADPALITVPPMRFVQVDGTGNPNDEGGAYQQALTLLYGFSYTVKMSKLSDAKPAGYFEYSVAPLEGLWEMDNGMPGVDYARKSGFCWTAMIRQPEFVTDAVFAWACDEMRRKKKLDTAPLRFVTYDEGLCAQCMHFGPYDDEPPTVARLHAFVEAAGLQCDYASRRHHEIYLKDPRRTASEKLRTVLRIPVRQK